MARRKLVQAPTGSGAILIADGVASGTAGAISRATSLDANHIHAWELDDASGNLVDTGSSGSKVDLTVTGTPVYGAKGLFGNCVVFGVDASTGATASTYARALVSAFSDLPATNWTQEVWFRSFVGNLGFLMGCDNVGAGTACVDGNSASTGQFSMTLQTTGFTNTTSAVSFLNSYGQGWHHLALTYDGTYGRLYLDGEIQARSSNTGNTQWSTGTTPRICLALGQNSAGQFRGAMSRFRLSNVVRSQSYLRTVYATGMGF